MLSRLLMSGGVDSFWIKCITIMLFIVIPFVTDEQNPPIRLLGVMEQDGSTLVRADDLQPHWISYSASVYKRITFSVDPLCCFFFTPSSLFPFPWQ
jgi:hypothetical protein